MKGKYSIDFVEMCLDRQRSAISKLLGYQPREFLLEVLPGKKKCNMIRLCSKMQVKCLGIGAQGYCAKVRVEFVIKILGYVIESKCHR